MSKPAGKQKSKTSKKEEKIDLSPVELIVRPTNGNVANSGKAYISQQTLKDNSVEAGSFVQLANGVIAIATPFDTDLDIVLIHADLQALAGLFNGDRIPLVKAAKPELCTEISVEGEETESNTALIRSFDVLHPNQWIGDSVYVIAEKPVFVNAQTKIKFVESQHVRETEFSRIGGLKTELEAVRTQVELPLKHPECFTRFNTDPERGILLYGPPGTGKTLLLKALARETAEAHVLRVNGPAIYSKYQGETESKLRAIFDEAERFAPSLIFVDEIDALAPKRDQDDSGETESRVVATLLTLMDGMKKNMRIVVIGATNRPNMLDPALRRPGRLGHEIEIGTPDAAGRRHILQLMLKNAPNHLSDADIVDFADRTHGFVGADIQALVKEAVLNVVKTSLASKKGLDEMYLEKKDLEHAFLCVRPSALREISLELPKVHWADIGGQDSTIQRLRETVEWPLQRAEAFDRLGISPPRGILLYGPPGCSKTLLAKALATEAGLNFLAVKGPELFNKYVGESERALREVFRKARQAAPSVIFFDEIDALSMARGEGEAGGDRVLTSLLNEMDGIESLQNVVVLAATNRPEVIDSALMRPGRLDRHIYVKPPGFEARRQILLIQFAKMAIDDTVDLDDLATKTDGFSGAEIVSLCQEAGLLAMNEDENIEYISQSHFNLALQGIRKTITPEMIKFYEDFAGLNI